MNKTDNVRVLVVDDDETQLASLRRILRGHFDAVTTRDPVQALKIFEHQGPFAVVISDYRMPLMDGVELFSRILKLDARVQRILFTGHAELQMAINAVNHGKITAFLTKPTPVASLRSAIAGAVEAYNRSFTADCPPGCGEPAPARLGPTDPFPLTVKEKEVLTLLAKGFSNNEIAAELNITAGTVKNHVNSLLGKFAVSSRSKVVAKGLELGLITLNS